MKHAVLEDPQQLTTELAYSVLLLNNRFLRPRRISRQLRISPKLVMAILKTCKKGFKQ